MSKIMKPINVNAHQLVTQSPQLEIALSVIQNALTAQIWRLTVPSVHKMGFMNHFYWIFSAIQVHVLPIISKTITIIIANALSKASLSLLLERAILVINTARPVSILHLMDAIAVFQGIISIIKQTLALMTARSDNMNLYSKIYRFAIYVILIVINVIKMQQNAYHVHLLGQQCQ